MKKVTWEWENAHRSNDVGLLYSIWLSWEGVTFIELLLKQGQIFQNKWNTLFKYNSLKLANKFYTLKSLLEHLCRYLQVRLTQTNKITRKSFQQQFRKIPLCWKAKQILVYVQPYKNITPPTNGNCCFQLSEIVWLSSKSFHIMYILK